jgi:hypothetical protein
MQRDDIRAVIERLLPDLRKDRELAISPVPGGGNNKLYRIKAHDGDYIIKCYFRHAGDTRDRLNSEFLFSSFAWGHGIRSLAEPIAEDHEQSVGIYRFIEGRKLRPDEVTWNAVEQALVFFKQINRYRSDEDALRLPTGSEACFTLEEHIRTIDSRLRRLEGIVCEDLLDREAIRFVQKELRDTWHNVRAGLLSASESSGIPVNEKLAPTDTILSPSDFGFHNALLGGENMISFIDFEYAGWDDPAKMTGDFFNQVAVPVPMKYFGPFAEAVAACFPDPHRTLMRIRMLLPVYRIKWCCIVLNHFLPVDKHRKRFADQHALKERETQLEKAKTLLGALPTMLETGG